MRYFAIFSIGFLLLSLPGIALGQSLGTLARKQRQQREAQSSKSTLLTNYEAKKPGKAFKPRFDATKMDDVDYLIGQLKNHRVAPDVFISLARHKSQAAPRLLAMLEDPKPANRIPPAKALIILGNSEGLAAMLPLLPKKDEIGRKREFNGAGTDENGESFQKAVQRTYEITHAKNLCHFGLWRFAQGAEVGADVLVKKFSSRKNFDVTKSPDRGQKIITDSLRNRDPNIRRTAISLVSVLSKGNDFGYDARGSASANKVPIQQIVSFIATRSAPVRKRKATGKGKKGAKKG
ncbi:MAG: hypothetical protein O6850_02680 [Acidobacteria bacterium]|nr:hypothetical protein [Acidobacteriota bacterium]